MHRFLAGLLGAALLASAAPAAAQPAELGRLKAEAARVTIVRDDWGIAHVRGKTDADAVFGAIYAQAEDDFNRVETNYLTSLGLAAEAEGEAAIWRDLRQRLFIDPEQLKSDYARSPAWLKTLMNAWADGLNYYLATHPKVQPKVIRRFEPWMALSFTEGSIGGDIEEVDLKALEAFYGQTKVALAEPDLSFKEPSGSNGIAIAPKLTADGAALLLINPHTSFYFRAELQMTSDEGLNAYGASTWGQFFIYQGFNETTGWMHTSSGVDVVDEFLETIERKNGGLFYRYGSELRPVQSREVTIRYKTPGGLASRTFTVYGTHHGPITRTEGDRWVAAALMNTPIPALEQSFLRTKQRDYASFMKIAGLKANSSNNTLFADSKGHIAYLHPQFIPRRDDRFDYTKPVDGSNPATDWKGLHELDEAPRAIDPPNGWVFNVNDSPYSAAGPYSPKKADFPRYMDTAGETPRTKHAKLVLSGKSGFTLDSLLQAAYDPYLPAFGDLVPALGAAWDSTPESDPLKARTRDQVAALRAWDKRWGAASTETSLAVFWGENLYRASIEDARARGVDIYAYMASQTSPAQKLQALAEASDRLQADFGSWRTPWGEINRFQRLTDDIVATFHDDKPSIPTPFTSAQWGSLASFGAKRQPNTKRYYGTLGNSFVAVVEFGDRVRARAVTAGGESGDPASPHFNDQAARYVAGNLRDVYFYPDQLKEHVERTYHPGS
jgi:acyl-homoserine-lactone acylase